MKNGKYCNGKKSLNMKPLAILLALTLLVGCAVGGTVAWLTAQTAEVTNTFTIGSIVIDLDETGTTNDAKDYQFVPGDKKDKDPYVTVKKETTADSYLFVKITETNNKLTGLNGKIINWEAAPAVKGTNTANATWTKYVPADQSGATYVEYWYCEVAADTSTDRSWSILQNDKVTVNQEITKDMVPAITAAKPSLKFDAAAVQKDNLSLADAWEQLPTEFKGAFAAPTA